MTTEEKNKAILNCGDDYDDILDIQYGKTGTPERDSFDREAEAFILAERTDVQLSTLFKIFQGLGKRVSITITIL